MTLVERIGDLSELLVFSSLGLVCILLRLTCLSVGSFLSKWFGAAVGIDLAVGLARSCS